jgi:ATP-dependent RNA helicase RhlE
MTFTSLGLSKSICSALREKNYTSPTPIQRKAIPAIFLKKDIIATAQTGTGKTASFTLPLIDRFSKAQPYKDIHIRALILTPTRELANQIFENIKMYSKYSNIKSVMVTGGVKIGPQIKQIQQGVDILVATPGRLIDLYFQKIINFRQLETLILDEADRMLDMGFINDIEKIINTLPRKRQTLLFSATFSDEVRKLSERYTYNPIEIDIAPRNTTVEKISQLVYPVDKKRKPALLKNLIHENNFNQILVFTKTKRGANKLTEYLLTNSIEALAIHGNKSQSARNKALEEFKKGKICVLVATDIAARGIDISNLPNVVNFELPTNPEDYIHRIGRTGRAGNVGNAYSFVSYEEFSLLNAIESLTKKIIKRKIQVDFEPSTELPHSQLNRKHKFNTNYQNKTSCKNGTKSINKKRSLKKRVKKSKKLSA